MNDDKYYGKPKGEKLLKALHTIWRVLKRLGCIVLIFTLGYIAGSIHAPFRLEWREKIPLIIQGDALPDVPLE